MTSIAFGQEFHSIEEICSKIGREPLVIDTPLPWEAHRSHTIILGRPYDGHVAVRITCGRQKKYYYLGDATGLVSPIFLKHFKSKPDKPKIQMKQYPTSYLISLIMSRLRSQCVDDIEVPEVNMISEEHMVQGAMKYICNHFGIMPYWLSIELARIEELHQHYSWKNISSIYPFLTNDKSSDLEKAYAKGGSIREIQVPDLDVYTWVRDVVINF
jgi:hypothetical protein